MDNTQDRNQVYRNHGYRNRAHYLKSIAEEMAIPLRVVHALAHMLGPNEDFDGLINALEDYENDI
jgi:hypothetical protein